MTDINKYMNKKLIQTMIYSGEMTSMLEDEELREGIIKDEFIEALYEFVNSNLEDPHINGIHLTNLKNLTSEIRFLSGNKSKPNEIITLLNRTKEVDHSKFLKSEFIKRFSLNPFLGNNLQILCAYTLPQLQEEHLFSSISYDYVLIDELLSTDPYDLGEFINGLEGLEHQSISTINAVKEECKELFLDDCFDLNSKVLLKALTYNPNLNIRLRARNALKK